jgi:hypothetical protein
MLNDSEIKCINDSIEVFERYSYPTNSSNEQSSQSREIVRAARSGNVLGKLLTFEDGEEVGKLMDLTKRILEDDCERSLKQEAAIAAGEVSE